MNISRKKGKMNRRVAILLISLTLLTSIICIGNLKPVKADDVTVISSSGFLDYGVYRIVGEVQNTGSDWENPQVTATMTNATGQTIDTRYIAYSPNAIPPGGKSPFDIEEPTSTLASQISNYTLQVTPFTVNSLPLSLEITSNSYSTGSSGVFQITGQLLNNGSSAATTPTVYATFYDSSGNVVDVALAYPSTTGGTIAPGASASFTLSPLDSSRQSLYASYTLIANSKEYLSAPVSSSTNATPEFPPQAVLTLLIAILLISAFIITTKKRKTNKN